MSPGNVTLFCRNHFSIFPCYVVCTNYQIKLELRLEENFKHLLSVAFCCGQKIHIIKYEIKNTNILQEGVNESNCTNTQKSPLFRDTKWQEKPDTSGPHKQHICWNKIFFTIFKIFVFTTILVLQPIFKHKNNNSCLQ